MFDSDEDARRFAQSVPVLKLSSTTVSIADSTWKVPRLFRPARRQIGIRFTTKDDVAVFRGFDFEACIDDINDPNSPVACGDSPFIASAGFGDSVAEEIRQKYQVPETYLPVTNQNGDQVIAMLSPSDRHMLGEWLKKIIA